jgi:pimeloyl-ACP methyl ester carboxylesterase
VVLVGTLRVAPGAPAVLLMHQLGSSRAEWDAVVAALSEPPGLTTLALDMRGHGESTEGPRGVRVDHTTFTAEQWAEIPRDVRTGLELLRNHPTARPTRIALVGSSIGATAVLTVAADAPDVDRVVALSPGRAYHGLDGITPVTRLGGRRLLVVASRGDSFSFETAEVLTQLAPAVTLVEVAGGAHGVAMFDGDASARDQVVAFLREAEL